MTWNIPNALTVLRLVAAPGVAVMFLYFNRPWADWCALVLFALAAVTDWIDGYLARAWKQESKFGAMMDPIADKAMVLIALLVIVGHSNGNWTPWFVLPATVIVYREVMVSGMREFLGSSGGRLKVTHVAKWKTTAQMIAIAVLFSQGIFEHHLIDRTIGMSPEIIDGIFAGTIPDEVGLLGLEQGFVWSGRIGLTLLWIAAALTLWSGIDYFRKALPFLRDT